MQKLLFTLIVFIAAASLKAAEPLRVFIRGGVKTHGPNQHDHPRFLKEWTQFLGERGLKADGAMTFPTAEQLAQTDVVIIYAADGMKIEGDQRANFEKFLQRGGGVVVIHDGIVSGQGSNNPVWTKTIIGGAWHWDGPPSQRAKYFEGNVSISFVNPEHPIVKGLSNFEWKDEIYYNLDLEPDVKVLATSFRGTNTNTPQLWTYEKTLDGGSAPYRAVVSLPGHEYDSFNTPHYRTVLLRGVAWAGKRANVNEFANAAESGPPKSPNSTPAGPKRTSEWGKGAKALLIGGGSSHDYEKWFNEADSAFLNKTGTYSARYFEPQELTADLVKSADVIVISANKAFPVPAVREAIFAHVNAGKGLILLHPGLWYNWNDWPQFNKELAGGGARGHNRLGEFEVKVTKTDHALVKGVPASFKITDELYWFEPDANGTPIEVLAEAYSESKQKSYPQVFVIKHPKGRIAGITIGHDARAHDLPAYQQLILNALNWAMQK